MQKVRNAFLLLFALIVTAFATSTIAASPTKQFAAAYPATVPRGTGIEIKVTFYNLTPNGNSYINSVELFPPLTGVTFTGAVRTAAGTATGTLNGTALIINNFPGIGPNRSIDFYVKVNVTATGCTSQAWPVPLANAGNSLQGDGFTPLYDLVNPATGQPYMQLMSGVGCDGTLACGGTFTVSGGHVSGAERLPSNKDGSPCALVNYVFTNNVSTTNDTLMQWDLTTQPGAGFQYTVSWQPVLYGSLFPPPVGQTKVAWYVNGVLTAPAAAQACLSTNPPTALGTLTASIDATTNTIPVSSAPPAVNTPIMIDRERMVIDTGSTTGSWKVLRGAGGTTAVLHSRYYTDGSTPKSVMSNPLPLDPVTHNQMQMCLIDEGWATVLPSDCGAVSPSTACVQKSSTVFDLGDGYMIGN